MMLGRHQVGLDGTGGSKPGWRRGKTIERFMSELQEACEALLLDDPCVSAVDVGDW